MVLGGLEKHWDGPAGRCFSEFPSGGRSSNCDSARSDGEFRAQKRITIPAYGSFI